jgi:hypothetical protein
MQVFKKEVLRKAPLNACFQKQEIRRRLRINSSNFNIFALFALLYIKSLMFVILSFEAINFD